MSNEIVFSHVPHEIGGRGVNSGIFSVEMTVTSGGRTHPSSPCPEGAQLSAPGGCSGVPRPRWEAAGGGERLPRCREVCRKALFPGMIDRRLMVKDKE